jgi:hypothetical protein
MLPRRLARRALIGCALAALTGAGSLPALAQGAAWPTQPVKILVGFPGGSAPEGAAFFNAARAGGKTWSYGSVGIGSVGLSAAARECLARDVPALLKTAEVRLLGGIIAAQGITPQ